MKIGKFFGKGEFRFIKAKISRKLKILQGGSLPPLQFFSARFLNFGHKSCHPALYMNKNSCQFLKFINKTDFENALNKSNIKSERSLKKIFKVFIQKQFFLKFTYFQTGVILTIYKFLSYYYYYQIALKLIYIMLCTFPS